MAILPDTDRNNINAELMREQSRKRKSIAVTKTDLRAAIDAVDQWIEDNKTSYNNAIPQPARAALTADQKALLLQFVTAKRFGVL